MDQGSKPGRRFRFGTFELDPAEQQLRRDGRRLRLQHKPFQLLAILVERPSTLVTREELRARLWPDTTVDFERGLNTAVNKLRVALRDHADNPRFVETVPRLGYRFIAPVETIESPPGGRAVGTRRVTASILALVALLAAVTWLTVSGLAPGDDERRLMLAVMPFEDESGDPDQEYFSSGLTEEMILRLARLNPQRLGVIARASVMRYKDAGASIDEIARDLGVDYILEGRLHRRQDRLRVNAELVRCADRTALWAESYDLDVQGWFSLQDDVAHEIVRTLGVRVLQGNAIDEGRAPVRPEAREAYLKGRYFRNQISEASFNKSLQFFEEAVRLEPEYADAYAGMGGCHCLLAGHGFEVVPPGEAMLQARQAALKALSLDDSLAEAHAVLGMVQLKYEWDFDGAERSLRRAVELDPNSAQAHLWHSLFFEAMGRQEEAVAAAKRARDLDPLSLGANANFGNQLLQAGEVDRAREQFEAVLDLDPDFWGAHWGLGRCMLRVGQHEAAIEHLETAVGSGGGNTVSSATLAYAYALSGQFAAAGRILEQLTELSQERYVSPAFIAYIHAGLGDLDAAFAELERAFSVRSRYMAWLAVAPEYEPLRTDSRYQDLLRRIGLDRIDSLRTDRDFR